MKKLPRRADRPLLAAIAAVAALALLPQAAFAAGSVYTANYFSNNISQFDIGAGGLLSPKTPLVGGSFTNIWRIAVSPDGESVYAAAWGDDFIAQSDVGAGGLLSPKSPATAATGSNPYGIALTPDGQSLYAGSQDGNVYQFDMGAGGLLSPKTPASVAAGGGPTAIAVSPDGDSAYAANNSNGEVSQFDIGPGGLLSPKTPATATAGGVAWGITITPDGQHVYVADNDGGAIVGFDVGSDGALGGGTPVSAGSAPWGIVASPDGNSLYMTDLADTIFQFDIDDSGALSPKTPASVDAGDSPYELAMAPDGQSLYSTTYADAVMQWNVGAGGLLTPKSPASVANDDAKTLGVAVTPNQGPAAEATVSVNGTTASFDGSASTDPDGSVASYDWQFGDGQTASGATVNHTYASPGTYTATLTATDDEGCAAETVWQGQTAYCNGSPPPKTLGVVIADAPTPTPLPLPTPLPTPIPTSAVLLDGLKLKPSIFRVDRRGKPKKAAKPRRGSELQFRLNTDARVDFTVGLGISGRVVGGKCVALTKGNRSNKRCVRRYKPAGSFSVAGTSGLNKRPFSGRLSNRNLKGGAYRLTGIAAKDGVKSEPRRARFKIVALAGSSRSGAGNHRLAPRR